jgi:hypothetical protein
VSETFHPGTPGAQFQPEGTSGRLSGPAPDHASYNSFATFNDPDGNGWLVQEVTAAHGEHEQRTGQPDENWPDWYAAYMVAEQAGTAPPS